MLIECLIFKSGYLAMVFDTSAITTTPSLG
jgi:hypothetical protein